METLYTTPVATTGDHLRMTDRTAIGRSPATDRRAGARSPKLPRLGRETGYLLATFPLSIASFVVVLTLASTGVSTAAMWVGIPILVAALLSASVFARIERGLVARTMGRDMAQPAYKSVPADAGLGRRLMTPLTDPNRWLEVLWSQVNFVVSTITFSIAVTWWAGPLWMIVGPILGFAFRKNPNINFSGLPELVGFHGWVAGAVWDVMVGLFTLVTLPWVIRGLAWVQSTISHAMLSMRGGYEQQIGALQTSRASARQAEHNSLRRLERDIHDGPQQRLIRLQLDLARAERAAATDPERARQLLADARRQTQDTLAELRNLSRGIAPPVLVDRGLEAALDELAARSEVLTTVSCDEEATRGLPHHVATTAYFVAAEALTNVNKHSLATVAHITVDQLPESVVVSVSDNGVGGASVAKGHGLAGLAERLSGVDGVLSVDSPTGGPTVVQAEVPCAS